MCSCLRRKRLTATDGPSASRRHARALRCLRFGAAVFLVITGITSLKTRRIRFPNFAKNATNLVPCAGETSANSGLFAAPRGSGMSAAAVRAALRLPPNCRGHGNSAAFCRKPLQCAGVAADGNPPPTFYAAGLRRWRHRFRDFRAALFAGQCLPHFPISATLACPLRRRTAKKGKYCAIGWRRFHSPGVVTRMTTKRPGAALRLESNSNEGTFIMVMRRIITHGL